MITRLKKAPLFFILSLFFALFSLPFSAALSQGRLERSATAKVAEDCNAVLRLEGFQNCAYNADSKYSRFGSITNNSNQIMKLTVTVIPEVFWGNNKNNWLGVKIGNETVEFRLNSSSTGQANLSLSPGQTVDTQAAINLNQGYASISFQITATNTDGTYTMKLNDTAKTPRRIICF